MADELMEASGFYDDTNEDKKLKGSSEIGSSLVDLKATSINSSNRDSEVSDLTGME